MTDFFADAALARGHMVDSQVRPNQVSEPRIIAAMRTLPRERFCPPGVNAYTDADIPLGGGRYMLAPMLIARLLQLVLAGNPEKILVIGAGAGYAAAILAAAGAAVTALEPEARLDTGALADFAPSVVTVGGPLPDGWPAGGPYDMIFIEGAITEIPAILAQQLSPAGRLVTILADRAAAHGLGRAVVAEYRQGFAVAKKFDCTARILPAFQPQPAFVF